uniref:Pupal cuticle protein Edg-78E n=1 Tax=Stomoxys calcitrans TaxID=35570 RepID=A0A1I8QBA3_STOCA
MFKFILLALLIVGCATHSKVANGQGYDYDETADIVEMAFDAAAADDDVGDMNDDGTGYLYNEGDLENNINIAVNAAILDKYGQAVTSERSDHEKDQEAKVEDSEKDAKANEIEDSDYFADKSETNVQQVEKPETGSERTAKSVGFQASASASGNNNNVANAVEKKSSKPLATPVKNAQYNDNDTITRFVSQVNADGTYGFDFAQSSGLEFREVGQGGLFAEGSYQYVSPEGEHISVTYSADETGFHPDSDVLPTPPPIPAYILRALEYIREHPTAEELADREIRARQI